MNQGYKDSPIPNETFERKLKAASNQATRQQPSHWKNYKVVRSLKNKITNENQ